ncbi:unnamed protein product [Strongylus vulgaris]|uniref:Uncharacterized protein n=1 Tax=Strongylus vulgaris TaxID=40348 RepID=A0A3P7IVI1_STRVU|nr:unnamed protein product [Strongylus vulgaris]
MAALPGSIKMKNQNTSATCETNVIILQLMSGMPLVGAVTMHWFIPLLVTAPLWTCLEATYTPSMETDLSNDIKAVILK